VDPVCGRVRERWEGRGRMFKDAGSAERGRRRMAGRRRTYEERRGERQGRRQSWLLMQSWVDDGRTEGRWTETWGPTGAYGWWCAEQGVEARMVYIRVLSLLY
jgi:hypothetical protein